MWKIYIYVTACEGRLLDAKRIFNYLSRNKYEITDKPQDADLIILVTCASCNKSTEHSLQMVKKLQKYDAKLIVAGCLPAIEPERLSEIFHGKTLITKNLDKDIENLFPPKKQVKFEKVDDPNILFRNFYLTTLSNLIKQLFVKYRLIENVYIRFRGHINKKLSTEHSFLYKWILTEEPLYYVRTSFGCSSHCSYCSIKKAIGQFRSKSIEQCIQEFINGLDDGYKNFVIVADDVGAYGIDIGSNLPELLKKMMELEGDYNLLIRDLNPQWFIRYYAELSEILKRQKITNLDIPIQSGNSRILKLMYRYSNVDKMKNAFLRLKKVFPELTLNTDVIVGFPTETWEEFKQTLDFIIEVGFDAGAFFEFSCKPETKAETIEPKISQIKIINRFKYTTKYLKNAGYDVLYQPRSQRILFKKK